MLHDHGTSLVPNLHLTPGMAIEAFIPIIYDYDNASNKPNKLPAENCLRIRCNLSSV